MIAQTHSEDAALRLVYIHLPSHLVKVKLSGPRESSEFCKRTLMNFKPAAGDTGRKF